MELKTILKDLVSVSPVINNRIEELMSSATQEETDQISLQLELYNEAMNILLSLLEENGIVFYADKFLLKIDKYNVGFIIELYRHFTTFNINNFLNNNSNNLLDKIASGVTDINDDEFIIRILEIVRDVTRSPYYNEMYIYFHDKIISTHDYVVSVTDTINNLITSRDNQIGNVTSGDIEFLNKLSKERHWFQSTFSTMIHKGALPINYSRLNQLSSRYCMIYSVPENVRLLSNYQELVVENPESIIPILKNIHANSEFHVDYYSNSDIKKLSICLIVSIILMQFTDYHLFGIRPDFNRLIKFRSLDIPIKSIIKMVPNEESL